MRPNSRPSSPSSASASCRTPRSPAASWPASTGPPTDNAGAARQSAAARYLTPTGLAVLAALDEIAAAHGVEDASVAIAWLLTRPGVVAPLASARTVDQLGPLLDSATLKLTPDEIHALDQASVEA